MVVVTVFQQQKTPAESLLKSTELLTRTGFVQQDQSLPPPDAPLNKSENVVVDTNLGETKRHGLCWCV